MILERYRSVLPDPDRFFRVVQTPEPTHLRVRTGRARPDEVVERLERRGFRLEPMGSPEGVFRVTEEPFSVANTLEHWLGLFYVQQAVTALAAPALDPRPGERVLDMAAAPGGKTTHIADLMEDRGTLVACDRAEKRLRALLGNVYRTSHPNVLALAGDARKLGGEALFDRVLLDAPCSGEGTLRKRGGDPKPRSAGYLDHVIGLQRGLLRKAVDLVRPGGVVLYVTCTFNPDENEAVVSRILDERGGEVEVEPVDLDVPHAPGLTRFEGAEYAPELEGARRIYPHHLDSGGLFICRLGKRGEADSGGDEGRAPKGDAGAAAEWVPVPRVFPGDGAGVDAGETVAECERQLREVYALEPDAIEDVAWLIRGDSVWGTTARSWAPVLWNEGRRVRPLSLGLRAFKDDPRTGLRPTNDLLQWLGDRMRGRVIEPSPDEWRRLLARTPLPSEDFGDPDDGFVQLRLDGRTVGRGLVWHGDVRHEIPKARAGRLRDTLVVEDDVVG